MRRVLAGEEAAFLAPLPVSVLGIDPKITSRLAALGIDRLGEVAALTPADLQRQFGGDGVAISRLARGEDGGGLTPVPPPRTWLERVVLDGPVADLEVLRFCLRRCAGALGERLGDGGLTAGSVALSLELDGGGEGTVGVEPPTPVGGGAELEPVVLGLLEQITVAAPVVAVRLELSALHAGAGRQIDMWRRGDASREAIAHTVARLRARFGAESVRRARLTLDPGDIPERRFTWDQPGAVPVRR